MPTHLCHTIASLSLLLIIAGLCHSTPLEKLRDKRDTRDLPSNLFKPVESSSLDTKPQQNSNENDANIEQSAPETYVFQVNRPSQHADQGVFIHYPTRTQGLSGGFGNHVNPVQSYNTDGNVYGGPFRYSVSSSNSYGPQVPPYGGFPGHTYGSPSHNYQRIPGYGDGSSNNYYRSESYRYNSDGNGPTQFEQSVYDSRLGPDVHVKRTHF